MHVGVTYLLLMPGRRREDSKWEAWCFYGSFSQSFLSVPLSLKKSSFSLMLSRLETVNPTQGGLDDSLGIVRKRSLILLVCLSPLPPMWRVYSGLSPWTC